MARGSRFLPSSLARSPPAPPASLSLPVPPCRCPPAASPRARPPPSLRSVRAGSLAVCQSACVAVSRARPAIATHTASMLWLQLQSAAYRTTRLARTSPASSKRCSERVRLRQCRWCCDATPATPAIVSVSAGVFLAFPLRSCSESVADSSGRLLVAPRPRAASLASVRCARRPLCAKPPPVSISPAAHSVLAGSPCKRRARPPADH